MFIEISCIVIVVASCLLYRRHRMSKNSIQQLTEEKLKPLLQDINPYEDKVRKQWLISLYAYTGFSAFVFFLGSFQYEDVSFVFRLTITVIVFAVAFLMPYFLAYKRRGTGWLTFTMIMLPLRELLSFSKGEYNFIWEANFFGLLMCAIILTLETLYWINCFRLREVNSSRKYPPVLSS